VTIVGAKPRPQFSPQAHEQELIGIIQALNRLSTVDNRSLTRLLKRFPKKRGHYFSKTELIAGVRFFADRHGWDPRSFARKLCLKPVRTMSGLAPVTVATQPYPCPGRCVFCPNDVRVPKSYLPHEPTVQRATQNRFDPYTQTRNRLRAFVVNGHLVDKVELIILGGSWSWYPEAYRVWFIKRCFDALNDFHEGLTEPIFPDDSDPDFTELRLDRSAGQLPTAYNDTVSAYLDKVEPRLSERYLATDWQALESAQQRNEGATCRCVGLAVETRPDGVSDSELLTLRRLGVTKVQIGVQSLDDEILTLNRRGHDRAATGRAIARLRLAGFKIHVHWMLNLLGSDPTRDRADFGRLFAEPDFRPDELKLYPCYVIDQTELMQQYRAGRWQPYPQDQLCDLLAECMSRVPAYCRITRVMRDVPANYIVAGCTVSNLRERVEALMSERALPRRDIRFREIRSGAVQPEDVRLVEERYDTSTGQECFLQFVTADDRLAAFLRLALPRGSSPFDELRECALIREVHTYGQVAGIESPERGNAQHFGLGRRLIEASCVRAAAEGFGRLAVISAVGTRSYYRRLGFYDGTLYQHRDLLGG